MFLVLPPRARADPRPVRDVLRPAHAHALLPGRRRHRGHPAGLRGASCGSSCAMMPARADEYGDLLDSNEIVLQRLRGTCPLDARDAAVAGRDRAAAARRRQPLGPAQGRPLLLLRGLRLQDPGRHRRRQLRPLRGPPGRDLRVGEDHRAGARRAARRARHHRRPQGRAAAAPRARHLDGGADPPLQARHRGLPRAAGRGLLPDRGPARRARLLRALRRLLQAGPRAHARPELRQPAGARARWSRAATSPT